MRVPSVSFFVPVCLSLSLPVLVSVCLCLCIYPCLWLYVRLSVCLDCFFLSLQGRVHASTHPEDALSVSLSLSLSVSLSVSGHHQRTRAHGAGTHMPLQPALPHTQARKHLRTSTLQKCAAVRGGLVFKAHSLLYYSTLGLRVINKKGKLTSGALSRCIGAHQNGETKKTDTGVPCSSTTAPPPQTTTEP
jgi:hypothetical protein